MHVQVCKCVTVHVQVCDCAFVSVQVCKCPSVHVQVCDCACASVHIDQVILALGTTLIAAEKSELCFFCSFRSNNNENRWQTRLW